MIEVKGLTKKYGAHTAVKDADFLISDGEIVGFLGPNGAGKTTTMNIITGYLSATQGSVSIDGYDVLEEPDEAKSRIGYLPEQPPLYLDMTVREYLNFVYDLKKVGLPRKPHIDEICRLVKISDVSRRLIKNLSKGYRQRVGIAQALVGNPDVLILDEPTVGLDPKQIIEIRTLIKHLGKNHTIILSSHILSEVQAVCERVIVINRGVIVADDTPDNLAKNLSDSHTLVMRVLGPEGDVLKTIRSVKGVKSAVCIGPREGGFEYSIEPEEGTDVRVALFNRMAERKWPVILMRTSELTLEEIFLQLTESDGNTDILEKTLKNRKAAKAEDQADDEYDDEDYDDEDGEDGGEPESGEAPAGEIPVEKPSLDDRGLELEYQYEKSLAADEAEQNKEEDA